MRGGGDAGRRCSRSGESRRRGRRRGARGRTTWAPRGRRASAMRKRRGWNAASRTRRQGLETISRSWGSAMSLGSIFQRHVAVRNLHSIESTCASDVGDDRYLSCICKKQPLQAHPGGVVRRQAPDAPLHAIHSPDPSLPARPLASLSDRPPASLSDRPPTRPHFRLPIVPPAHLLGSDCIRGGGGGRRTLLVWMAGCRVGSGGAGGGVSGSGLWRQRGLRR